MSSSLASLLIVSLSLELTDSAGLLGQQATRNPPSSLSPKELRDTKPSRSCVTVRAGTEWAEWAVA